MVRRTASDSSGWEAITDALALSTWSTSKPRASSPSKRSSTLSGSGLGTGESQSEP